MREAPRLRWAALCAAVAAVVLIGGRCALADDGAYGLDVGQKPPPIKAADLNGDLQTLDRYKGDVLIVHFWATWCPYCRGEIAKLKKAYALQGVAVLSVSADENQRLLHELVEQREIPYPVIPDGRTDFAIARNYGISGVPVTLLIDKDGRIAEWLFGPSDIVGITRGLLRESGLPDGTERE